MKSTVIQGPEPTVLVETMSGEERKALLAQRVADLVGDGRRVEWRGEFEVELEHFERSWLRERDCHETAAVDEYGQVSVVPRGKHR